MAEIRVLVDGNEYTLDQFRRDAIRMFDYYRTKGSDYMGKIDCKNVPCNDCPLSNKGCNTTKLRTFETIETVYEWSQEHPVVTNRKKLKEIFGEEKAKEIISRIMFYANNEDFGEWFNEEYKEPDQ